MDEQKISSEARLAALTAQLNALTANANYELQYGGYWLSDWGGEMSKIHVEIDAILGTNRDK